MLGLKSAVAAITMATMVASSALAAETAPLAHTLKGSARGIGAFNVAECASALEAAGQGGDAALAALRGAVAEVRSVIEARLGRR